MRNRILLSLFVLGLAPWVAKAQVPGDACSVSGSFVTSGGPTASGVVHMMTCDGSNWVSLIQNSAEGRTSFQVDNDTGSCVSAKTGRLRYNSGTDTWEYCDGSAWSPFEQAGAGASSGLCVAPALCPNIGDTCDYSDISSALDPIFAGFSFYDGSCEPLFLREYGSGSSIQWTSTANSDHILTDSLFDGLENYSQIEDKTDFPAFDSCEYSNTNQYARFRDWYLPARNEVENMFQNMDSLPELDQSIYWTSTERTNSQAYAVDFSNSYVRSYPKGNTYAGLCVRRNCTKPLTELLLGESCNEAIYAGESNGNRIYAYSKLISGSKPWNNGTTNMVETGANSETNGAYNTDILISIVGSSSPYEAAKACRDLGNEWYLPAKEELEKFMENRNIGKLSHIITATGGYLWSSTEIIHYGGDPGSAYVYDISNEISNSRMRSQPVTVQCIRRD